MNDQKFHLTPNAIFDIFLSKASRDEGGDVPDLARTVCNGCIRKLLKVYAGQDFKLPKWDTLEKILRNVAIYMSIEAGVPAPRMEEQFGVSRQRAHQLHLMVKDAISNYLEAVQRGDTQKRVFSSNPKQDVDELMAWLAGGDGKGEKAQPAA